MPNASSDILDILYRAAQVVTRTADEASDLIREVVRRAVATSATDNDLLTILADETRRMNDSSIADAAESENPVSRTLLRRDIHRVVPEVMADLDPTDRVRLVGALLAREMDAEAPPSIIQGFVEFVRAELGWRQTSFNDDDYWHEILDAARQFLEENTEHASPTLYAEIEGIAGGDVGALPAADDGYDREQVEPYLRRSRRFAGGLVLILIAALLGTWLSSNDYTPENNTPPRLFELIESEVGNRQNLALRTSDVTQVESFIRDRLGWKIVVPQIQGASLDGVSFSSIADDLELPVLWYRAGDIDPAISVSIIAYSKIQSMRGRVVAERSILDHIASEGAFDISHEPSLVRITWRHRDDVYVAVIPGGTPQFRNRISMP